MKNTTDSLWQAGQIKNCAWSLPQHCAHQSESCVSCCREGLVLESGVWSMDPGRTQLLTVKRQREGTGVTNSTTRKVFGKSPKHHRSKVSLLSSVQGAGLQLQPLFPPASFFTLCRHWEGFPYEGATQPLGWGLLQPHGLWGPEGHPSQSLFKNHPWAPLPGTGVLQCWWGLSAKACS